MNQTLGNALIALATKGKTPQAGDDLDQYIKTAGSNDLVAEALEGLRAKERATEASEIAHAILNLSRAGDAALESAVSALRQTRRLEAQQLALVKKISRAKAYALQTQNWLPLALVTGSSSALGVMDSLDLDLLEVPEDWSEVPPEEGRGPVDEQGTDTNVSNMNAARQEPAAE